MASPERSASRRLAIQAEGSHSPDPEIFRAVLEKLQRLAAWHRNAEATGHTLAPAARYLSGAITIYAKTKCAGLSDTKHDNEEMLGFRVSQAAQLAELAREMEAIMGHPACQYLLLTPPDEIPLRALLLKLTRLHENLTPADEALARRNEARARLGMATKDGKGTPQQNRKRICHAIEHAWFISTGQENPPRRKQTKEQETYGEFPEFIRDVLNLTAKTRHMDADEVHRDILKMGK